MYLGLFIEFNYILMIIISTKVHILMVYVAVTHYDHKGAVRKRKRHMWQI